MIFFKTLVFVVLFQNCIRIQSYEYCSKELKLCRTKNKRHIVCHKEQIEPEAEYVKHFPMTDVFKNWILYWHNYYRNDVACGKVSGRDGSLPNASQMKELAWDYELEYIARIHAGRCKIQHDQCRNTERIPISGQNLAYRKTTGRPDKALDRSQKMIYNWFHESVYVTRGTISNYRLMQKVKIGHFTVLAKDMVGRVGCAMTLCKGFPQNAMWTYQYLTCNYDHTNIPGTPVYKIGEPTSTCNGLGKSSNFSCLCATSF